MTIAIGIYAEHAWILSQTLRLERPGKVGSGADAILKVGEKPTLALLNFVEQGRRRTRSNQSDRSNQSNQSDRSDRSD